MAKHDTDGQAHTLMWFPINGLRGEGWPLRSPVGGGVTTTTTLFFPPSPSEELITPRVRGFTFALCGGWVLVFGVDEEGPLFPSRAPHSPLTTKAVVVLVPLPLIPSLTRWSLMSFLP